MDADFGNRNGSFKQDDTTLGGFFGWYTARCGVNAQVSYSWLSYDVDREVQLGPAPACTAAPPTAAISPLPQRRGIRWAKAISSTARWPA
ncbi:autotransporter domain-containing protein [Xanthomonas citri]|uniref:autotransporter domain-containing protein n=1 Tax=Xanthomonas citri TaxID=346 RepID=UPI002286F02E|nr:autotransporter domain-containing protein [Xanthomonas citri]